MSLRRAPARSAVAASVVLVVALTGCSSEETPSADTSPAPVTTEPVVPSSDAIEGVPVTGDGYRLLVPPGWTDSTEAVRQRFEKVDLAAGDSAVSGDFSDNVNVVVSDKRRIKTQRKAERILRSDLRQIGKRVRIEEPGELDGEVAYRATARLRLGRLKVRTSQYFAKHADAWYLVTFSYGPQTDATTEAEEVQAMLDSWSWED